ncbi:glycosyltransferase family 4 protein [Bacillus cereus]
MKIGVLTKEIPYPPHKNGGANTIFNIFKRINNANVDLIVLNDDKEEYSIAPELERVFNKIIVHDLPHKNKLSTVLSSAFTFHTFKSVKLYDEKLKGILEGYDIVFIHDFPLIKYCTLASQNKLFFICDSQFKLVDSYAKKDKKILRKIQFKVKKFFYKKMFQKYREDFGTLLYISKIDMEYDKELFPTIKDMAYINNGVDLGYFSPVENKEYEYDLIFLGNLSYKPNYDAVVSLGRDIVPMLSKKYPNIKCVIVGKNVPEELRQYSSKHIIFTGFVEDVREYLNKSKIFVSPLYSGAGMKNKILEAMAMNKIIIASDISYEGIEIRDKTFMYTANNDKEFVECIEEVVDNFSGFKNINNRSKLFPSYSWDYQAENLFQLFQQQKGKREE